MYGSEGAWGPVAALLVLVGGVGIGFAFARGKYVRAWIIGLAALVVAASLVFLPRFREIVQCRIGGAFRSRDAHPPELLGAWVGWDTSFPTPYCRLELAADGTGRCDFWYERDRLGAWRVTQWEVTRDTIAIAVESGERRERMKGEVFDGALSLRYFGSDGPDVRKNWFGPLRLVREETDAEAREAVRRAPR